MSKNGRLHRLADRLVGMIESPLYTAGISAYAGAVRLASLRNRKAKLMIDGQRKVLETLSGLPKNDSERVWIHSASLGEFEQARPIIERLRKGHPEVSIVLSFFSPSGFEVRKDYPLADAVVYLPFDTPGRVRKFIETVNPSMAIFIKYEFWRNYLHELNRRGIPTFLVSAIFRPDQMFFRPAGARYRRWLQLFNTIYVQDQRSISLLKSVGMTRAVVAGDTRFDRVTDIMANARRSPEAEAFSSPASTNIVFGSSWPADEELYISWLKEHPEVHAIIAPHEFNPRRISALKQNLGDGAVALSELKDGKVDATTARYLIVDCFGLLSSLYRLADWAYVGGGFGAGLHNINEAAVYGIPVVYGPNNAKFLEAKELAEAGGGFPVSDSKSLNDTFSRLLDNKEQRLTAGKAAGAYIKSKLGASDIIYSDLFGDTSPYLSKG